MRKSKFPKCHEKALRDHRSPPSGSPPSGSPPSGSPPPVTSAPFPPSGSLPPLVPSPVPSAPVPATVSCGFAAAQSLRSSCSLPPQSAPRLASLPRLPPFPSMAKNEADICLYGYIFISLCHRDNNPLIVFAETIALCTNTS